MIKPLCVVSCPIDVYSGYSARSRDFVRALVQSKGSEWDIKIMSQRWGTLSFGYIRDHKEEWGWLTNHLLPNNQLTQQPDYWFQITIPSEFQPVGKWNCGVTAGIETTFCHPTWLQGCNRMNLVLVSSVHAKTTFEQTKAEMRNPQGQVVDRIELKVPVEVLFEGVNLQKYFPVDESSLPPNELVQSINTIPEEFAYLFVGHWMQGAIGEDRKNVGMLIKVFLEAFKNKKKKPALILKTTSGNPSILDREDILKKISVIRDTVAATDLPSIYLLHGEFAEDDMNRLYNHPKVKAMVSLTKGEGYGRPLIEFTQAKKPIIASGWSGHLDFLSPDFTVLLPGTLTPVHPSAVVKDMIIPESSWFTPDASHSINGLREVFENYSKYLELAKRQAYKCKSEFSLDAMKESLAGFLNTHAPVYQPLTLPKMPALTIPKLTKIK